MDFRPYTYNGTNINDGTIYSASFPRQLSLSPQTSIKTVRRAGAFPVYAGKEFPPHSFTVDIQTKGTFTTQLETLMDLFDVTDEEPYSFVVQDADDSNTQYAVDAVPVQFQPSDTRVNDHGNVKVTMSVADDPVWTEVSQSEEGWTITASGGTYDVTVGGNTEAYPTFEITPNSAPTNTYLYKRYVTAYPTSTNEWTDRPLEVTGGGWDTATLVTGGKMQSDGDDLRVLVDGKQVPRWLNGMDGASTKVWVVLTMPPAGTATLLTAIADSGTPDTIDFEITGDNRKTLWGMPKRGIVLINSEQFTYTDKTNAADELSLTVDTRAVRGTSAAAHSQGDTITWIPYDIIIKYGNAAAEQDAYTAPDVAPIIGANSTNSSFIFSSFREVAEDDIELKYFLYDIAPCSWDSSINRPPGSQSTAYLTDHNNDANEYGNPSEVLGMIIESISVSGGYITDNAAIRWTNNFPDGVGTVSATGYTYRAGSLWPATAALESSTDGINWVQEWNESSPGTASTWTAWTHSNEAVPASTNHIRFRLKGAVSASGNASAMFEVAAGTVTLVNYPTVSLGSETQIYNFDAVLTNTTTGDRIKIDYPTTINDTLIIDCDPDNPTATLNGQMVYSAVGLDTTRNKWMTFAPNQTNTLRYTQAYTGTVYVNIIWHKRMISL